MFTCFVHGLLYSVECMQMLLSICTAKSLFKGVHVGKEAVMGRKFPGLMGIPKRGNANAKLDQ